MSEIIVKSRQIRPQGGTCSIYDAGRGGGGRSDGASYCEPKKKMHEPEILHPKKYLELKFSTQEIQD